MADIPIKPIKFNVPGGGGQQFYPETSSDAVLGPDGKPITGTLADAIDNLSDAFSEEVPYQVGDYCIYKNILYKFIAAKEAGAWDSTKVSATTVEAELKTLANAVTELNSKEVESSDYITLNEGFTDHLVAYKCGNLLMLEGYIQVDSSITEGGSVIGTCQGFRFTETPVVSNAIGAAGRPLTGFIYGLTASDVKLFLSDRPIGTAGICFTGIYKLF